MFRGRNLGPPEEGIKFVLTLRNSCVKIYHEDPVQSTMDWINLQKCALQDSVAAHSSNRVNK